MKVLILALALAVSSAAYAGVAGYTGSSGEKLWIEQSGKDHYVKFEGVESPWSGKVIKTKKRQNGKLDIYEFTYKEELSSGIKEHTYGLVNDAGTTLVNGSTVKKIKLYTPENRKGIELKADSELTKSSQGAGLATAFKKAPFEPEVD